MRTSVFSVEGCPSKGSRCRKLSIALACCQMGSSSVPSNLGARSIRLALAVRSEAAVIGCAEQNNEIRWSKNCPRCNQRPHRPRYHVPDERSRYNNRPRSDHRDRNGIDKLALSEPVELCYNPAIQERNNCQPTAEYESASLQEKKKQDPDGCD